MLNVEALPIDLPLYTLALFAVFAAAIIQSGIGMGFGLVAGPALLLIDPALVPSAVIVVGTPVGAWATIRDRDQIILRELGIASIGRVLGALVASQTMVLLLSPQAFKVLFATVLLLVVALSVVRLHPRFNLRTLFAAGIVSGITGTIAGLGGPPLALVYQDSHSRKVRATLNATITLGGLVSLAFLWAYGLVTSKSLWYALLLMPGLVLGIWCSRYLHGFLDQRLRPVILGTCCLYGFGALLSAML